MKMTGRQMAIFVVGILVLVPAAQFAGRYLGEKSSQSNEVRGSLASDQISNVGQDTQVIVSKQSSDGITNDQIDVTAAETIGQYSLERMRYHTQKILDEMQSADDVNAITQKTVLIADEGKNIVVTRIYTMGINNAVQFFAVDGLEATRVLCQSEVANVEVLLAGKCQNAVREQLGFELGGKL